MKIVFASDSFKGSLSSARAARLAAEAARDVFPGCEAVCVPIADGGEGTLDAVKAAGGCVEVRVRVTGPLGEARDARFLETKDGALIEMAEASGLTLVPPVLRNPLKTSTRGTGELIRAALERGARRITVAVGGSATNDGGMGALSALGVRFLDEKGLELSGRGEDLTRVVKVDMSRLLPPAKEAVFTVMCDVDNPLTGPLGATYTFGPQKGGTAEALAALEKGMKRYAAAVSAACGRDIEAIEGGGAAGGLAAALAGVLGAELRSGIDCVLDLIGFDGMLSGADLVVTGEGKCDAQSAHGKAVGGIAKRCAKRGVPVIALCGSIGEGAAALYGCGVDSIASSVCSPMDVKEAMSRAEELYKAAALRAFRMVRAGIRIQIKHSDTDGGEK